MINYIPRRKARLRCCFGRWFWRSRHMTAEPKSVHSLYNRNASRPSWCLQIVLRIRTRLRKAGYYATGKVYIWPAKLATGVASAPWQTCFGGSCETISLSEDHQATRILSLRGRPRRQMMNLLKLCADCKCLFIYLSTYLILSYIMPPPLG